jgi:hypothetical protein
MENKIEQISFALRKVTTEQFAIIEDGLSEKGKIRIKTDLRFAADEKQKMIAVFSAFTFESDTKPFLIIEAGCHFTIEDHDWEQMLNKEFDTLTVPKGFMSHLAMLTVGTTRGILHAKTEGSCFNVYVLPTINVAEMIKEDTVFKFNAQ